MAGAKKKPKSKPKQSRANKIWTLASLNTLLHDGELELDLDAKISESDDNGAYIETWMWFSYDGTELDKGDPAGPKDWSPIKKPVPTRQRILALARETMSLPLRDGELEMDLDAKVSEGDDNGAYIQTWMWVSFHDTYLDKESE